MANKITVKKGKLEIVHEDIFGHQIGNGAVQILQKDGNQHIIAGFDEVLIERDDEGKAEFQARLKAAELAAKQEGAVPGSDTEQ